MKKFFVHPQGICETTNVGDGTRIWAFTHVLSGARIGQDCNICDGVFIENDVVVGDASTVKSGVQLWDGVRLGNRVFVGPNVTFTNDKYPKSKLPPVEFARTRVEDDASIGANSTVLPGVKIGSGALIGAGSVVVRDVPDRAIVVGNPGCVVGYAGAAEISPDSAVAGPESKFRLIPLMSHIDSRGTLAVADQGLLPFIPKRFFIVGDVPSGGARGGHAHRQCQQLMVVVSGRMIVAVDDGKQAFAITISSSAMGLLVPPLLWSMQYGHSADAKLLVLCSDAYDRSDYISSYTEFVSLARTVKSTGY